MKKVIVFSLVLMVLFLCACSKTPDASPAPSISTDTPEPETIATQPPEPTPTVLVDEEEVPSSTEAETGPIITGPIQASGPEGSACVLQTDYYVLDFSLWGNNCICVITPLGSGGYTMSLHEYKSFEKFGGGKLCTLMMMPTGDDTYKDFPDYQLLCVLDTPEGSFNLIALFPTDVQFSEETAADYNAMYQQLPDVLYTLSPREGVEMAMPAPVL